MQWLVPCVQRASTMLFLCDCEIWEIFLCGQVTIWCALHYFPEHTGKYLVRSKKSDLIFVCFCSMSPYRICRSSLLVFMQTGWFNAILKTSVVYLLQRSPKTDGYSVKWEISESNMQHSGLNGSVCPFFPQILLQNLPRPFIYSCIYLMYWPSIITIKCSSVAKYIRHLMCFIILSSLNFFFPVRICFHAPSTSLLHWWVNSSFQTLLVMLIPGTHSAGTRNGTQTSLKTITWFPIFPFFMLI